jgi:hypothetical protein
LGYISQSMYTELRIDMDKIIKQLNGLYKYQLNNKQNLKIRLKD